MPGPLPRSTPADQQVDPGAVLAWLDALEADPDIEMHSVMVLRHGHVVAEGWWAPYSADRVHLLYSLSKSFTSTAAAFAREEGLLELDDTVLSHFPELDGDVVDPRSRSITLRDVLAMASGHTRDVAHEAFSKDPDEPVRGFLSIAPEGDPGSVFAYNQPCTYSVASVIQRNAGTSLTQYLRSRLFDPLGIGEVGWQSWPPGRELGFTGLHARTEDVAKLGQLYLQGGRWEGSQLVPEEWVAAATSKQIDNSGESNVDWRQGYGYQFWMHRHGYRGDGAFGQFCVVLPEHDAVFATTASTESLQGVLDAAWEHLLPGFGASGDLTSRQAELADRLAGLHLPALGGSTRPPDDRSTDTFEVSSPDRSHGLKGIEVETTGENLELSLVERSNRIAFPVSPDEWAVSTPTDARGGKVPVAASGGWLEDGTLRIDVIFLETPHRFHVTVTPDGVADVHWNHVPLGGGRLADMHCPRRSG